jgi:hypothetical protein
MCRTEVVVLGFGLPAAGHDGGPAVPHNTTSCAEACSSVRWRAEEV